MKHMDFLWKIFESIILLGGNVAVAPVSYIFGTLLFFIVIGIILWILGLLVRTLFIVIPLGIIILILYTIVR